jgi:NAD(P)-dependent dehydrogenase (short-subunit alcohol dehydrogenase family)
MQDKRVALVTGANQGIGLQIAKDLVTHGFIVLVGSRNLERGEAAAKEVGPDAHALRLDVTDHASITAAAERIRNEFGRLDVLIQNAAISNTTKLPAQSFEDYAKTVRPRNVSLDEMRAVWETNVFGVLAVYQRSKSATFREDLINDMISREGQPAEWPDALLAVQTAVLSPKKLKTLPGSRRRPVRRERPLNMLGCMALLHAIRSAAKADKR